MEKWATFKQLLEADPVGSTLYGFTDSYVRVPVGDFATYEYPADGIVAIPTADGLYTIPYQTTTPDEGYELFLMDQAGPADMSVIEYAINEMRRRADELEKLYEQQTIDAWNTRVKLISFSTFPLAFNWMKICQRAYTRPLEVAHHLTDGYIVYYDPNEPERSPEWIQKRISELQG